MDKSIRGLGGPSDTTKLVCLYTDEFSWGFISMMFKKHQSDHFCLIVARVRMCHWTGRPATSRVFLASHFQTVNAARDITSGWWQIRGYGLGNVRCVLL